MKNFITLIITLILILSCSNQKYSELILGNITIDVPSKIKPNFVRLQPETLGVIQFYESYGFEETEAIFSVLRSRYKTSYAETVTLEGITDSMINDIKMNAQFKEFELISKEKTTIGDIPGYIVISEFYYGPNKTRNKFAVFWDNDLVQIMCMYNKSSKKSEGMIDKVIKSVRLSKDEI